MTLSTLNELLALRKNLVPSMRYAKSLHQLFSSPSAPISFDNAYNARMISVTDGSENVGTSSMKRENNDAIYSSPLKFLMKTMRSAEIV